MTRNTVALALALSGLPLLAQEPPRNPNVTEVTWREVYDSQGNRSSVPVFSRAASDRTPAAGRTTFAAQAAVLGVDERFRVAKLTNDVRTMESLRSDDFFETNQNGNSRDKPEALELWTTFPIRSLTTERATIRLAGDVAMIAGQQTEVNGTGTDRMLFTRVYVRSGSTWQLLSSTQFRNPTLTRAADDVR